MVIERNDADYELLKNPDESPERYRKRAFATASSRYEELFDAAYERLREKRFEFESLNEIHLLELRRDLLQRHSLPYFLVQESLAPELPANVNVLAACLAGHTLALTHLDYHFDGALPDPTNPVTAVKIPAVSAATYAVRMAYFAASLLGQEVCGSRVLSEVIDPISGFVIARMHEDWKIRYSFNQFEDNALVRVNEYLETPDSRLMASGYWEVMARAAFISSTSKPLAGDLVNFCTGLRKLRQVVDEAADFEEDVIAGFATLPLLLAGSCSDNGIISKNLKRLWSSASDETNSRSEPLNTLIASVKTARVARQIHEVVENLVARIFSNLNDLCPRRLDLVPVLVDVKLAKLQSVLRDEYGYSDRFKFSRDYLAQMTYEESIDIGRDAVQLTNS